MKTKKLLTLAVLLLLGCAGGPSDSASPSPSPQPTLTLSEEEIKKLWSEVNGLERGNLMNISKDPARSLELLSRLAAAGDDEAMLKLADGYAEGWDGTTAKDFNKAKEWYLRAAAATDSPSIAYANIGDLYRKGGPGLAADGPKAKEWYEKAIAAGFRSSAPMALANLYRHGAPGLEPDWVRAKELYEKSQDSDAYKALAEMYKEGGHGLKKDPAAAEEWAKKAATNAPVLPGFL